MESKVKFEYDDQVNDVIRKLERILPEFGIDIVLDADADEENPDHPSVTYIFRSNQ